MISDIPPEHKDCYSILIDGVWRTTDNLTFWQNLKYILTFKPIKSIDRTEHLNEGVCADRNRRFK